ncbi:hypothetical protein CJ179_38720 [Rhodococcus sp. ACS1]|uniref:hypothetical protein n=1 Tax=Rhodococcus sp. ACS1 TaxID=2028570 RepID=UPI000BB10749|nr:hypothetical protein [Rhodococcus sp. ACS1]PBC38535.1 hypothetical protein CJ179_38720 [Rhodococcus sp. ACS1]
MTEREVVKRIEFVPPQKKSEPGLEDVFELLGEPYVDNPDREFFYEGLKVLRCEGEGNFPPVEVPIIGWQRIADSLHEMGYRRIPELVTKQWRPTPGFSPGDPGDRGKFYRRLPDGTWPKEMESNEIDLGDIEVKQQGAGFIALHEPTGVSAEGGTKLQAQSALLIRLEEFQQLNT